MNDLNKEKEISEKMITNHDESSDLSNKNKIIKENKEKEEKDNTLINQEQNKNVEINNKIEELNNKIKSLENDKKNLTKKNRDLAKEKEKLLREKIFQETKVLQMEQKYQSELTSLYAKNNSIEESNIFPYNNDKSSLKSQSVNINLNSKNKIGLGNSANPLYFSDNDKIKEVDEKEESSGNASKKNSNNPKIEGNSTAKDSNDKKLEVNDNNGEDSNKILEVNDNNGEDNYNDIELGVNYLDNDIEDEKDENKDKNKVINLSTNIFNRNKTKSSLLYSSFNNNVFEFGKNGDKERELSYEINQLIQQKNNLEDKLEMSDGDKEELKKLIEEKEREIEEKNKELNDLNK